MNNKFVFVGTALAIIILIGFIFQSLKDRQAPEVNTNLAEGNNNSESLQSGDETMDNAVSATTSANIQIQRGE